MPILGLLLGHGLAAALGHATRWIGAGLLIATGIYALGQAVRSADRQHAADQPAPAGQRIGRMLITGLGLSIDNLVVGFALGAYRVNFAAAAIVIGVVSVALSLFGLELGSRIGTRTGDRGELIGGSVLIGVGIAIAAGVIWGRLPLRSVLDGRFDGNAPEVRVTRRLALAVS
jgi:putative Mn2+ efflux pump MntP